MWQGDTLKEITNKLGYRKRVGVTTLWVSPIFRQVAFEPTYHGYGIQNPLDAGPLFGTCEEFRDFVVAAYDHGICESLDVVAHHTGNVFT
jgi:glycosidase